MQFLITVLRSFFTAAFFRAAVMQGIPLLYGAVGEILTEKSGNLNLGIAGIMYMGAIGGLVGSFLYESSAASPVPFVAMVIAILCALLLATLGGLIYAVLTITFRANQNVTGLALTTFGMGVANFFGVFILDGRTATQSLVYKTFQTKLPVLSRMGMIGQTLFGYGFMV